MLSTKCKGGKATQVGSGTLYSLTFQFQVFFTVTDNSGQAVFIPLRQLISLGAWQVHGLIGPWGWRWQQSGRGQQSLLCDWCDYLSLPLLESFEYYRCSLLTWQVSMFIPMQNKRVSGSVETHVAFVFPLSSLQSSISLPVVFSCTVAAWNGVYPTIVSGPC